MSIYATLWHLRFPRHGDAYAGCESGDPYEAFLRVPLRIEGGVSEDDLRAVVFVSSTSTKGTARSGQEYESPLLVLTGAEYAAIPFQVLHDQLCAALRGTGPQLVLEVLRPDFTTMLVFDDGSTRMATLDNPSTTMPSSSSIEGRSTDGADHD